MGLMFVFCLFAFGRQKELSLSFSVTDVELLDSASEQWSIGGGADNEEFSIAPFKRMVFLLWYSLSSITISTL